MNTTLTAQDVSVRLGGRIVVRNVGLTLRGGEFVVLVGPNGAGKTTLIRALAGLIACDGVIVIDGVALTALSPRERARRIAYLPQGSVFHWPMNVAAVVELGRHPHGDPFSRWSETDRIAVDKALAATAAGDFAERAVTSLSGGERARVALARALATEAPFLLADEPIVSLDPRHQLVVMDLLHATAKRGCAVLAVVHDLALAARFADRVIVLSEGTIAADAPPHDALSARRLADIFGIEAVMVDAGDGLVPLPRRAL